MSLQFAGVVGTPDHDGVEAVGPGVTRFRPGDKVFGMITTGLRSANEKLDALLSDHLSAPPQAAEASR